MARGGCVWVQKQIKVDISSQHDYPGLARVRSCRVVMDKPLRGIWPSNDYAVFAEIDVVPDPK